VIALIVIGHCKRTEHVPHWQHQATMAALKKPCLSMDIYESHIFDIGASRQAIAESFLSFPEATHLLFVDDDITIPDSDSLVRMFNFLEKNNESIVSGLYYNKTPPHHPLIMACEETETELRFAFPYAGKEPPRNHVIKVGAVPCGFLLIKRQVFEKIPKPWFVYGDPELARKQLLKRGAPPGEDIYFSLKARKHGFNLWVDTRADLLHYVPTFVGRKEVVDSIFTTKTEALSQAKAELLKVKPKGETEN